jgi:2-dehydro-3-deoxy-D-arabinonate dehydratase
MKLVRFVEGTKPLAGLIDGADVLVYEGLGSNPFKDYMELRKPDDTPLNEFWRSLTEGETPRRYDLEWVKNQFIMPMIPAEVWAAGVTYKRSVTAREDETEVKGIYDHVYESTRPEVLFKGLGYRTVGPNDIICIRSDATWNVPEPEFTLVYGERKIVGYMIGNDVSSRDIEGENPLYLPQAKVFRSSCSIGPYLATTDEFKDPKKVGIKLKVYRENEMIFSGETSTSQMKRSFEELTEYLFRDNPVPRGSIMLTGVGVVPPDDFSLLHGDLVEISMDGLGTMRNRVRQL